MPKVADIPWDEGMLASVSHSTKVVYLNRSCRTITRLKQLNRQNTSLTSASEVNLDFLERDTMEDSWQKALRPEFEKPYFQKLKRFLATEHASHTIYPPCKQSSYHDGPILNAKLTPLDQVKVIILGQDPYHNIGQAHGLAFSVLSPTKPPASLINVYKQLKNDYPSFNIPKSGDLSPLAKLGVLWLNTCLTVQAHKAASHSNKGWESFTEQVIRTVLERKGENHPGVVFMAWGLHAQKICAKVGIDKKRHLLLTSAHPSPLSAHRGFLGNGHFKLANLWLTEKYGSAGSIDWTILSSQ